MITLNSWLGTPDKGAGLEQESADGARDYLIHPVGVEEGRPAAETSSLRALVLGCFT